MVEENAESTETENQAGSEAAEESQTEEKIEFDDDAKQTDESGTSDEKEESQNDESNINQEAVDKKINRLTFQKYEEKRKREAVEAKLQETQTKLKGLETKQQDIQIPPVPDAYDPQYQILMTQRDNALKQQAILDAQKEITLKQQGEAQQQAVLQTQQEITTIAEKCYTKAAEIGIDAADLQKADARVAMFIKDPALARFIMAHDDGPLIIKHLASSVTELESISKMDSISAAAHIAAKIAPKAKQLKPDYTKAPDPLNIPGGRGAGEKQSQFLDGVKFE